MHLKIRGPLAISVAFSLFICFFTSFGCSRGDGPSLKDIPRYPNATQRESMGESFFGGIVSIKIEQYTTDDSYDKVFDFYTNALKQYETNVTTYATKQGRQTAIDIAPKKEKITIAIQEFAEEGKVNITLMWAKD